MGGFFCLTAKNRLLIIALSLGANIRRHALRLYMNQWLTENLRRHLRGYRQGAYRPALSELTNST